VVREYAPRRFHFPSQERSLTPFQKRSLTPFTPVRRRSALFSRLKLEFAMESDPIRGSVSDPYGGKLRRLAVNAGLPITHLADLCLIP